MRLREKISKGEEILQWNIEHDSGLVGRVGGHGTQLCQLYLRHQLVGYLSIYEININIIDIIKIETPGVWNGGRKGGHEYTGTLKVTFQVTYQNIQSCL